MGQKLWLLVLSTYIRHKADTNLIAGLLSRLDLAIYIWRLKKLKADLRQKGYFDDGYKKEIPKAPKTIGVSTSPTGAAVTDILTTLERRFPLANVYFRPTIVQGDSASADIASAIEELNQKNCDVIIIGRGGGSIEDLWAYNTERVAEAIFKSKTPIISAVGARNRFHDCGFCSRFARGDAYGGG